MSKHTPGPWMLNDLCDVYADAPTAEHPHAIKYIVHQVRGKDEDTLKANAALVAAAPDLMEALLLARPFVMAAYRDHGQDSANTVLCMIANALDKAGL